MARIYLQKFVSLNLRALRRRGVPYVLGLICLDMMACSTAGGPDNATVLAEVSGRRVEAGEFRRFVTGLQEWTRSELEGEPRVRDYLQSLVDRTLILVEAERRGLGASPELQGNLAIALRARLGEEMEGRMVRPRVVLSNEDMRREFEEQNWARQIKIAHIFIRDRERGTAALAALDRGTAFEVVAHEYSDNRTTAARGGEKPYFYSRLNATDAVREPLFGLQVGEVSELIRVPNGWEIFRVLDEYIATFEEIQPQILKVMLRERTHAARRAYVDSLEQAFAWRLQIETMARLMAILRGAEPGPEGKKIFRLSVEDREQVLFAFRDGAVTIGEAIGASQFIRQGRYVADSLKVATYLDRDVRTPRLMLLHAVELGVDREPRIVNWRQRKQEELLIRELRRVAVSGLPPITEQELRDDYESRPSTFLTSATATVIEVQVETAAEAAGIAERLALDAAAAGALTEGRDRLRERLLANATTGDQVAALRSLVEAPEGSLPVFTWLAARLQDPLEKVKLFDEVAAALSAEDLVETLILRQLAVERSVRHGGREAAGELVLHRYDQPRFGKLVDAAMEAEVGAVLGPLEHESAYSVAKVIARKISERQSFEKVRRRVRNSLVRRRQNEAFERWLQELRRTSAAQIVLHDENIARLAAELDAEMEAGRAGATGQP